MGRPILHEKLQRELEKEITEESQVVYILSRIRKILEIDNSGNRYRKLKFYCDWALHTEINRNRAFQKEFEAFVQGDMEAGAPILTHEYFETELLSFLQDNDIPSDNYKKQRTNFRKLLAEIYSDTPIVVEFSKKFRITTNAGAFSQESSKLKMEVGFSVVPLDGPDN